jgi:hypothetical protein
VPELEGLPEAVRQFEALSEHYCHFTDTLRRHYQTMDQMVEAEVQVLIIVIIIILIQ